MSWDGKERRKRLDNKTDRLIWQALLGACGLILIGGGGWATSINQKVDKLTSLEATVSSLTTSVGFMQKDINEIKDILKQSLLRPH